MTAIGRRVATGISVRLAEMEDAELLLALIRELARYERAPEDAVSATPADLIRYGFGPERRFEALLAEIDGEPAGFALFFPGFSTWAGRPTLYLEDIFVREWARGRGVGRALMACLASIAIEHGWRRLDLSVLDWNPARDFYHRLGIDCRSEWLPYRAEGEALLRLAAEPAGKARR